MNETGAPDAEGAALAPSTDDAGLAGSTDAEAAGPSAGCAITPGRTADSRGAFVLFFVALAALYGASRRQMPKARPAAMLSTPSTTHFP